MITPASRVTDKRLDADMIERRFQLWFFRDLSSDQRVGLLRLCFYPAKEFETHSSQQIAFSQLLRSLPPFESKGEAVAWRSDRHEDDGGLRPFTAIKRVADIWTEQGLTVTPLYTRPQPQQVDVSDAARDVLAERQRQIGAEGWTSEHDDQHNAAELALAAGAYCQSAAKPTIYRREPGAAFSIPMCWPSWWDRVWWKPKGPREDLVKAGALILAEIERLDRAEGRS